MSDIGQEDYCHFLFLYTLSAYSTDQPIDLYCFVLVLYFCKTDFKY